MISKVRNNLKNNTYVYIIAFIHLLFLIYLYSQNLFKYETMDDFYQLSYFSGMFGEYSPFVMFSNAIYGFIISILFRLFPVINWMTFLYVVIAFLSYNTIFSIIINNIKNLLMSFVLCFSLFIVSFRYMYLEMNFSKIALIAVAAGSLLLIERMNEDKFSVAELWAYFLITWGCLIRGKVGAMALAFFVIPFLYYIRKGLINKRRTLKLLAVIMIYIIISFINMIAYKYAGWNDAIYRERLTSGMRDYGTLPEEHWDDIDWDVVGIDKEDMVFLSGWHFADKNVYSNEVLERLGEYEQKIVFSPNYMKQTITKTIDFCFDHAIFTVSLVMACIGLLLCGNYHVEIVATVLLLFAESIYLVYNNRYPDRVAVIPWFMSLLTVVYCLCKTDIKNESIVKKAIALIAFAGIIVYSLISSNDLFLNEVQWNATGIETYLAFINGIDTTNSDDLYIENYTSGPYSAYKIFECPDYGVWKETVLDAGCMSLFPDIYKKSSKFGSDLSPYEAMLKSDHVYLIDERYFWEKRNFIRKHYNQNVDVSWVYSHGDFDAYSYTNPMIIDNMENIGGWSVDSFGQLDIKPEFYIISGSVTEDSNASIYYLEVTASNKAYYYEARVDNGVYALGIPVDTWQDESELSIRLLKKIDGKVIGSKNKILLSK